MPKQIVAKVGEELHRAVKIKAAQQGLTINEAVKRLLERWVKGDDDEHQVVHGEVPDRDERI